MAGLASRGSPARNELDVTRPRAAVLPTPPGGMLGQALGTGDVRTLQELLRNGLDARMLPTASAGGSEATNRFLEMARKQQSLWPEGAQPLQKSSPEPAWLQALKNYDFEAASQLLRPLLPKGDAVRAWKLALKNGDADLAKALLVTQPEAFATKQRDMPVDQGFFKSMLATSTNVSGQLHEGLKLKDPALSAYLKRYPYFSPKRPQADDFNKKAFFPGTNEKIACRHLALEWLEQLRTSPTGKPDYRSLSSIARIEASVRPEREDQFEALEAHAKEAHVVEVDRWGEFAARQHREMEANGVASKRMLIETEGHAMAVEFKLKAENGKTHLVQKVYDPNNTNVHRRSRSDAELGPVTLGASLCDFVENDAKAQTAAFGKASVVHLFVVPEEGLGSLPPADEPPAPNRRMQSIPETVNAETLFFMLQGGYSGNLVDMAPEIVQLSEKDPAGAFELLSARNSKGGPGLSVAMKSGSVQTLDAYFDMLDRSRLQPSQKMELLSVTCREVPLPPLASAAFFGCLEPMQAFMAAVGRIDLDVGRKLELLMSRPSDEVPPLLYAAAEAAPPRGVLRSYVEAVSSLPLDDASKRTLLHSHDEKGVSALHVAMHCSASNTAGLAKAIVDAPLEHETKLALLEARRRDGLSAYEAALRTGNSRSAEAFRRVVEGSTLPEADKARLLSGARGAAPR